MEEFAKAIEVCAGLAPMLAEMDAKSIEMSQAMNRTADAAQAELGREPGLLELAIKEAVDGIRAELGRDPSLAELASLRSPWLETVVNYSTLQTQQVMTLRRQSAALEHVVCVLKDALRPRLSPEELADLIGIGLYVPEGEGIPEAGASAE